MNITFLYVFCVSVLVVFSSDVFAQADIESEKAEGTAEPGTIFGLGWLDKTQAYASNSANSIANQLDRFFGVPRSDLEAPYSSLRLTWINSWEDIDDYQSDVRVRGKLYLPGVNERISLIFSSDENDNPADNVENELITESEQSTKVDLDVNFVEDDHHRIDFRLGLNSSFNARFSLRYRYESPIFNNFFNRFSQSVYFNGDKGFGSLVKYQFEEGVGDNGLLRWQNDLRFEEDVIGAQWHTGISYFSKRSSNTGVTYYYRIGGQTSPTFTSGHDIGVRIRRNIARPWLFIEVEPGYTWQKEERDLRLERSAFIFIRLEMAIGRW